MLVTAIKTAATNAIEGYAAGRVAMTNGMAEFDPPAWQTTYTSVAGDARGAAPTRSSCSRWSLFGDEPCRSRRRGPARCRPGSRSIASIVTADISGLIDTTRWFPMVPAAIAFGRFRLPSGHRCRHRCTAGYSWTAANVGDAVNLRASWDTSPSGSANAVPPGPHHVQWDAILPPDATMIAPPPIELSPPANAELALRYVDGSVTDGFPATEIHADTIVPPVTDGEIRVTEATGLR